ncbi:uncharacterized protein V1516DRAFT_675556 [Lipomyces oligophaga]|uniref:uncharacterized protein n=1 Tax=Lipomyces oligophaga TaxID=45792 RepID=UPI0034CFD48F
MSRSDGVTKYSTISLESLRLAALQSRTKKVQLSKSVSATFSDDNSEEEGQIEDTFGLESSSSSLLTSTPKPVLSDLDPELRAAAVEALTMLSQSGLSFQDILTYGDIHPMFLSQLLSTADAPLSTSELYNLLADSTNIVLNKKNGTESQNDIMALAGNVFSELIAAGLDYNDIVRLGDVNPVFLTQLVIASPQTLHNRKELLLQAGESMNKFSESLTPYSNIARVKYLSKEDRISSITNPSAVKIFDRGPVKSIPIRISKPLSANARAGGTASETISINALVASASKDSPTTGPVTNGPVTNGPVLRTFKRRPVAMDLDTSTRIDKNLRFGSDRSGGRIVIEMSDSDYDSD